MVQGHNKAVDWWALGILVYEMLAGYPPFFDDNPFGIYEKILSGKIDWPRHVDPVAKDLIKKFLVQDRTKRLGNMKNGTEDVKRHRYGSIRIFIFFVLICGCTNSFGFEVMAALTSQPGTNSVIVILCNSLKGRNVLVSMESHLLNSI